MTMKSFWHAAMVLTIFICIVQGATVIYSWKTISYSILLESEDNSGKETSYIPENNIPFSFAYHIKSKLMFVTVPRLAPGIPSSLNAIDVSQNPKFSSPLLSGFPNFTVNQLNEETFDSVTSAIANVKSDDDVLVTAKTKIISVYSVTIDTCDRLWFVDTGVLAYKNGDIIKQKPSLWIIDLSLDENKQAKKTTLRRYVFPENLIKTARGLRRLAVDVDKCDRGFAYIPNNEDNTIIVYDYFSNDTWHFQHNSFNPDPKESSSKMYDNGNGRREEGITTITLGRKNSDGFKTAYYYPAASTAQYSISTKIFRDKSLSPEGYDVTSFQQVGHRGCNSNSVSQVYEPHSSVVFFAENTAVRCWNISKSLIPGNIGTVFNELSDLTFVNDVKLDQKGNLWWISNRRLGNKMTGSEVNFRLYRSTVDNAIKNTVCSNTIDTNSKETVVEEEPVKIEKIQENKNNELPKVQQLKFGPGIDREQQIPVFIIQ